MNVGKMHSTQQRMVLKQCNSHDKINTHQLDTIPRFSSNEMITSDSTDDNLTRSQSCSDKYYTNSKRHKQCIYSVNSVRQTTVIVHTILLFAICAIVVECRQLPRFNIHNSGESAVILVFFSFLFFYFVAAAAAVIFVIAVFFLCG